MVVFLYNSKILTPLKTKMKYMYEGKNLKGSFVASTCIQKDNSYWVNKIISQNSEKNLNNMCFKYLWNTLQVL